MPHSRSPVQASWTNEFTSLGGPAVEEAKQRLGLEDRVPNEALKSHKAAERAVAVARTAAGDGLSQDKLRILDSSGLA